MSPAVIWWCQTLDRRGEEAQMKALRQLMMEADPATETIGARAALDLLRQEEGGFVAVA